MTALDALLSWSQTANRVAFEHTWVLLGIPLLAVLLTLSIRRGSFTPKKIRYLAIRILLVSLLTAAIAAPYLLEHETLPRELPPITILQDASTSMDVYPDIPSTADTLSDDIKALAANLSDTPVDVDLYDFSRGNATGIGDILYSHAIASEASQHIYVLLSDGQNNRGRPPLDVAKALGRANTTLHVVAPTTSSNEVYVAAIAGQSKVPLKADYDLVVEVAKLSAGPLNYKIEISVDGAKRFGVQKTQTEDRAYYPLSLSFSEVGIHEITAEITPSTDAEDTLPTNNVHYKSVEVIEKPRILVVVGNETSSPLVSVLDDLYNVTVTRAPPLSQLPDYNAIVVDNVPTTAMVRGFTDRMRSYILDGNGVWVVGGKNSYEYGGYHNSAFENLLPVRATPKPKELRKPIAVVFLLDVSNSFSYSPDPQTRETKLDVEKAIVLKMMKDLKDDDQVAVIAMNAGTFALTDGLERFGDIRERIQDQILQLVASGGTIIGESLDTSKTLLAPRGEKKFLILISDGVYSRSQQKNSLDKVSSLADLGVTTYAIGLGFDTDEYYLSQLAKAGNGLYLRPEGYQRLKLEFGRETEEQAADQATIAIRDQYHYITRELSLPDQAIADYNKVNDKSSARVLLTAEGDQPILAVWQFGLGRVAALATDNGLQWSPALYEADQGRLVAGIANWVLGDMEKQKPVRIETVDGYVGDDVAVGLYAERRPTLFVEYPDGARETLPLRRLDANHYEASLHATEAGFYPLLATTDDGSEDIGLLAVNPPREHLRIGVDEDILSSLSSLARGGLYDIDHLTALKQDLAESARNQVVLEQTTKQPLWQVFVLAAGVLYLLDTIYMRLRQLFARR